MLTHVKSVICCAWHCFAAQLNTWLMLGQYTSIFFRASEFSSKERAFAVLKSMEQGGKLLSRLLSIPNRDDEWRDFAGNSLVWPPGSAETLQTERWWTRVPYCSLRHHMFWGHRIPTMMLRRTGHWLVNLSVTQQAIDKTFFRIIVWTKNTRNVSQTAKQT